MSSCFVIEMVYEKTLFIALHCIHQFKSKAVFDSNFQSALDYGFLVRETNGFWIPIVSGIADSLMGWMPRNSDFFSKDFPDSGFRRQKFQGFRNLNYLATLNDSRMGYVFSLVAILYFSVGCCAIWNPRNFGGSGTIGNFENSRRSIHLPTHYRPCINEIR